MFEEKKATLPELVAILRNNWEGSEPLRLYVKNRYTYYGNDADGADGWHTRLLNDFAALVYGCSRKSGCPVKFIPGVSTFGRQVDWLPNRCATAFGYRKGDILSGNDSPGAGHRPLRRHGNHQILLQGPTLQSSPAVRRWTSKSFPNPSAATTAFPRCAR